jgi:glycosyltransferase involved in cell wall biosynthesis
VVPVHFSASSLSLPAVSKLGLEGKHAGMVTFSPYPFDPRPRRAVDALLQQGMSVDLICVSEDTQPKHEQLNGLNVRRLPIRTRRGNKATYAYQYCSFISLAACILGLRSLKRRYDLVYVHNMPDILVFSAIVPKLLGAKVILDLHDPMPELMTTIFNTDGHSFGVQLMKRLEKLSIAFADSVITVNIACQRIFAARSGESDKIAVIMNTPDDQVFSFRAARWQSTVNDDRHRRFVIMYHGSLVERNGLDLAVDALARVRRRLPGAELRAFGKPTPFLERVMAGVRQKGLENCVHFLGPRRLEELVREIEGCDVGVIPNHRNAFTDINTPTRIFEYLALGKPVIAPRASGICDYFDDRSLVLFELGNAEDLAGRIEYVFFNPVAASEIVTRGQEVYIEHSWGTEKRRLMELVAGLLSSCSITH